MSRTDATKPYYVKLAEHGAVEEHDHRHGTCDLPASPYEELRLSYSDHHCRWTYTDAMMAGCCLGCRCKFCDPDKVARRRRERTKGKLAAAAGRDEDAITKERWPPSSKRKNTKRWCKGKHGREHRPMIRESHLAQIRRAYDLPLCFPSTWQPGGWSCYHQLVCSTCGKILIQFLSKEQCPTYRGDDVRVEIDVKAGRVRLVP